MRVDYAASASARDRHRLDAITLNFVLLRTLPGDAVSALRCRACSTAFKEAQSRELGLDQSHWTQYRLYIEIADDVLGAPSCRRTRPR